MHREIMFVVASEDDDYGRPYVRTGDVLVFVYWDEDGTLRVTVDTEDCEERQPQIALNVNNGTVWAGVPGEGES